MYSDENDGKRFKDIAIDSSGSLLLYLEKNEIMEFDSENLKKINTIELKAHACLKTYFFSLTNVFVFFDQTGKSLYYQAKETGKTELIYTFENEILMNYFGNLQQKFLLISL